MVKNELIVISGPVMMPQEAMTINRLFDEGLGLLHLRKPGLDAGLIAELLAGISADYHERIALHQNHELAGVYNIRRFHFKEAARAEGVPEQQEGIRFSTSVHTPAAYRDLPPYFDYAFYGPVFDSISKKGYKPTMSNEIVGAVPPVKLIAIGGIDEGNCLLPFERGYDGVAVLGAIWERTDPVKAFKNIQQCITAGRS